MSGKMFTTKMREDKENLQSRFSKIRSKDVKTAKLITGAVFALIIITIISVSVYMAANRSQDDIADNADIKLTLNGALIKFDNEPYVLSESRSTGYTRQVMAYFPLEELAKKVDYLSSIETEGNKIVINLPGANDIYTIEIGKKEIHHSGKNINSTTHRTTYYAPEMKNDLIYIPYEFIEYLWIDANSYDIFGSTLYKNEELNVRFEIPMYWLGKFFADETKADKGYVIFRHTAIAEKYDTAAAGMLFAVRKKLDKEFDMLVNTVENQTIVWQNREYGYVIGTPTDVWYPVGADSDTEDISFADEYERMAKGIPHIEATFSLINRVDTPVITNAENLSYARMKDLQRQVDNGHLPWRLDYKQVMQSYLSGKGFNVEDVSLISFAGDDEKCSGTCDTGNYRHHIELFKPIDKTEHGIWIVRSYKMVEPVEIKEVIFHNLTKKDNKSVAERVLRKSDGWYNLFHEASSYINFNGAVPQSVVAKFTPAGTEMQEFEKEVGCATAPFEQIPILINMSFSKDDTIGHLHFEFNYEDGTAFKSELFIVSVEH